MNDRRETCESIARKVMELTSLSLNQGDSVLVFLKKLDIALDYVQPRCICSTCVTHIADAQKLLGEITDGD